MKSIIITFLVLSVLFQTLIQVEGACKAHDAKWKKNNRGPTISQPTRSDPTKVMVSWSSILENARCVDAFHLHIWKEGETMKTGQKIMIKDKKKMSEIVTVDPCLQYNFMVMLEEDDWTHTDKESSGTAQFRTQATSTLTNIDKNKFLVSYHFNSLKKHHDLTKVLIKFPRSILKNPSCVLHIEATGTELVKNPISSNPLRNRDFLTFSDYPQHPGHYDPGSSGKHSLMTSSNSGAGGQGLYLSGTRSSGSSGRYPGSPTPPGSSGHYPGYPSSPGSSGHYPGYPSSPGSSGHYPGHPSSPGSSGHYPGYPSSPGSSGHYPGYPSSPGSSGHYPGHPSSPGSSGHYPGYPSSPGSSGHYPGYSGGRYPTTSKPPSYGSGNIVQKSINSRPSVTNPLTVVKGKVTPPFFSDIIEVPVTLKSCNPYKFTLKIVSPRNSVIAEVKDIMLPQLSEATDFRPPMLSSTFQVDTTYVNKVLIPTMKLKPNSGIPELCLSDFLVAVDQHLLRLEGDLAYHMSKERAHQNEKQRHLKQIDSLKQEKLGKLGCVCDSVVIKVNTTNAKLYKKNKDAFGFYRYGGMQNGRPFYQRMDQQLQTMMRPPSRGQDSIIYGRKKREAGPAQNSNTYHLYWDDRDKAWSIGKKMDGSKVVLRTEKKSPAKCPADPQTNKKWTYSSTFSWKKDQAMSASCYKALNN